MDKDKYNDTILWVVVFRLCRQKRTVSDSEEKDDGVDLIIVWIDSHDHSEKERHQF